MQLFAMTPLVVLLAVPGAAASDTAHPAPRFPRADRREKLASAFPAIEVYLAERMASDHVPGLAFGSRHRRRARLRQGTRRTRRRGRRTGRPRHRLPDRLDDEELHGPRHPEAARRGPALARRPGVPARRGSRLAGLPDARQRAPDLAAAPHALGGLSGGQPLGRPAARGRRRRDGALDAGGHPVLDRAGHRFRILELRLRDPRSGRRARLGDARTATTSSSTSSGRWG